jgi:hypothetical protein
LLSKQSLSDFVDEGAAENRVKGIVSRDLGVLFFISLNRYEPRYRAGSRLFFILMTFLYLNF